MRLGGVLAILGLPFLLANTTIQTNICQPATTPIITAPSNNQVFTTNTTIASGTTTAMTNVTVTDNGQQDATVMSDSSGDFQVQITLVQGTNQLGFQASNPCGTSAAVMVTVTANLPTPPPNTGSGSSGGSPSTGTATGNPIASKQPATSTSGSQTNPSSSGTTPSAPQTTVQPTSGIGLIITTPTNHLTTSKDSIFVGGTTDQLATETVTVNGTKVATLSEQTTSFGVSVPLQIGENNIVVTATDGTHTESASVTINRIPYHAHIPWYKTTWGRTTIVASAILISSGGFWLILGWRRRHQPPEVL